MKVKYNIPFVVTSGGRLLTCSHLDDLQDNHNFMEQEFQQLKDSAFSGQDVEIRRGIIPIELDLEQLFTPLVVSPQTADTPGKMVAILTKPELTESSASTCTEKVDGGGYEKWEEVISNLLIEEENSTPEVLRVLKKVALLVRSLPKTELERVSNDCRDAMIERSESLADQFTTEDQALLVADLSNAKFDGNFSHVIIPVKDLQYLDSL